MSDEPDEQRQSARRVETGMRLQEWIQAMDELIDEFKGKELTPHRYDRLKRRFKQVVHLMKDAIRLEAK